MKSVIHEARTISKAIEEGWIKAGKPKDFTIKIFEEPRKNFFGFTTKNAKVGIFIEERTPGTARDSRPRSHSPAPRRRRPYQLGGQRQQYRQQNQPTQSDQHQSSEPKKTDPDSFPEE